MLKQTLLVCGGLLAASGIWAAAASSARSQAEVDKLAVNYNKFAGSSANAQALVAGLRYGSSVSMTGGGTTTTFTPATKAMGFGSVNNALTLAKTELLQQGISHPTPAQIEAALNGGTITTPTGTTRPLTGILQLRSQGKGWGRIASSMGVKLGPTVSASRTDQAMRTSMNDRPERFEKPVRPERIERPVR